MEPWIFYGSVAANHWFPDFRKPKDIDILTKDKFTGTSHLIETKWHDACDILINASINKVFLDADLLFTNKVSHAHWDIKWDKTMFDIRFFIEKGCVLRKDIYDQLIPIWSDIHGKKRVNLNVPNEEFFTGYVTRKIPHDLLHSIVAGNDRPMFEKIKKDKSLAMCSEDLFNNLTQFDKIKTCLEEICVIAIERYNLNANSKRSTRCIAFNRAFKQLITTMTSGWFALYLIQNVDLIMDARHIWIRMIDNAIKIIEDLK